MIVYTISQLLEMSEGTVPEAFRGKVKKVFPANAGEKNNKPWKLQKLVVTDGTLEIEVMFDSREDVTRGMEGAQIYVVACRGERGLKGVKRKDNNFKNKITPQVWVYDDAEVSFEGAAAGGSNGSIQPANRVAQPASSQQQPRPEATNNGNGHKPAEPAAKDKRAARAIAMQDFNKRVGRTSAALNRCFDAAYKLIADVNKRHGAFYVIQPTGELVEKIAMGIMVNSCWNEKPSQIADFPIRDFQSVEAEDAAHAESQKKEGAPFN